MQNNKNPLVMKKCVTYRTKVEIMRLARYYANDGIHQICEDHDYFRPGKTDGNGSSFGYRLLPQHISTSYYLIPNCWPNG